MSFLDGNGEFRGTFKRLTVSTMDPHSTSLKTRTCLDCHTNPKTLGLGYGTIYSKNPGSWGFRAACSVNKKLFGQEQRLDAFVDESGKGLVHTSRKGLRPFNKKELDRIIKVGFCLPCHRDMQDPVMQSWKKDSQPQPCSAYLKLTFPAD